MSDALLIDRQPLGTGWAEFWTLNAPATRNALTDEIVLALRAACERAQGDGALRVVVLRGAGGHFCAGGSLGSFASAIGRSHGEGVDPLIAVNRDFGRLLQALCDLPQVLVAAVQGAVAGGGLGLMLTADYVVASPHAKFVSRYANIGLTPDLGVSTLLPAAIGQTRALRLLLQDETIDAATALDWGLVTEVADDPGARAAEIATFWLDNATAAFGQAKRLVESVGVQ